MKYVIVFNNSPVETNNYFTYHLNAIQNPEIPLNLQRKIVLILQKFFFFKIEGFL